MADYITSKVAMEAMFFNVSLLAFGTANRLRFELVPFSSYSYT